MTDWAAHFKALAEAMETGLEDHEGTFGEAVVGPTDFDALDFPAAHIIPDRSDYQDSGEYLHTANVLYYFERTDERRGSETYLAHVEEAGNATASVQTALSNDGRIGQHKPISVEHFAGATSNTMLAIVQVGWRATTLVDFAE